MGLDFTNIKDHPGAAIFLLWDGTESGQNEFQRLKEDIERKTKKQTILLSAKSEEGRKIVNFYRLRGTKFVIIIRDNDQLHHVWSDGERFDASHIAYTAEQAG